MIEVLRDRDTLALVLLWILAASRDLRMKGRTVATDIYVPSDHCG